MNNKEKKNAIVLVDDDYEDLEFWYPLLRMRENGIDAVVVAPEAGRTYHSKHGYPAVSDTTPEEVTPEEIGLLVIPGGHAPEHMRQCAGMVQLVRSVHDTGGMIAFICHGGLMACAADILKGRKATSVSAIRDDMTNAGARWEDEPVVVDGNLISSRTPDDLPLFCRAILKTVGQRFTTLT